MDGADGITIALGTATTGLVVKEVLAWLRSRHQKTEIDPTPLPVTGDINMRKDQEYVSTDEFNERMKKVDGDIAAVRNDVSMLRSDILSSNTAVLAKLDANDQRSEERAQKTHARLDPFINEMGAVRGKMDIIEKAALSAMGGKK